VASTPDKSLPAAFILLHSTSPENIEAIGRVAVQWGILEMTVDETISSILRLNEKSSFAILVGITLPFKLDMLANLLEMVGDYEA
jgi:hypothetical protein